MHTTPDSSKQFALQTAFIRTKVAFRKLEPSGEIDVWRHLPRFWLDTEAHPTKYPIRIDDDVGDLPVWRHPPLTLGLSHRRVARLF